MFCVGSHAQEKLFQEGLRSGRAPQKFYYAKNTKGKGVSLEKMKQYAAKQNYLLGNYTTKQIDRFGDKQTAIDGIYFMPLDEYPKYVFEYAFPGYGYDGLKQHGSCWFFIDGKFIKYDNVSWSGKVENGMLEGSGYAFWTSSSGGLFFAVDGQFQKGLPMGLMNLKQFSIKLSEPTKVLFESRSNINVGLLGDGFASFSVGNGKWGFVTSNGIIAIEPKYETVIKKFDNGKAEVKQTDKEIIIDKTGQFVDYTVGQKKIFAEEKAKQDAIKAEEERQRRLAEQKAEEERRAAEEERRIAEAKEEDLKRRIEINKNPKLWTRGCRLCYRYPNGNEYVIATLEEWNENRTKVKVKIIASPSSTRTLNGDLLEKNNTMWVSAHNEGWHLALDDEIAIALDNDNSVKRTPSYSSSSSSSSSSSYSTCSNCHGSGQVRCTNCYGKGTATSGWDSETSVCSICGGRGIAVCYYCKGTGKI